MEDSIQKDAELDQEIDLVTNAIEDSEDSSFDVGYIEQDEPVQEEVEESQEEAPIIEDVPNKENPQRFEYWQSKFSQEQQARKDLEQKLHSFEEKMDSFSKPPIDETPKPPIKPNSDDPLDRMEYLEKQIEYNNYVISQQQKSFEQQAEAQRKAQEQAQFKAFMLGQYQSNGADEKLSAEAFNFFSSEQSLDPSTQLQMYRAWKDFSASQPNPKVNQMKTKQDKYKIPLPPGAVSGSTQEVKVADFGDDLVNYTKNHRV